MPSLAAGRPVFLNGLTSVTLRSSGCVHRQGELKGRSVRYVCRGPQPATMGFHDRTADRESHAHATGFGGEEGFEQLVSILVGDPDAAVRHTYQHLVWLVVAGSDQQFARPIRD